MNLSKIDVISYFNKKIHLFMKDFFNIMIFINQEEKRQCNNHKVKRCLVIHNTLQMEVDLKWKDLHKILVTMLQIINQQLTHYLKKLFSLQKIDKGKFRIDYMDIIKNNKLQGSIWQIKNLKKQRKMLYLNFRRITTNHKED